MEQRKYAEEPNHIVKRLLQAEGFCLLGVMLGMQIPKKYKELVFTFCAWFGACIGSIFILRGLAEKFLAKKEATEEEGFIVRIIEEE